MSNIECPHYGDNVADLQRSIADAPSENFFDDPTINQGYQYLLASIKNSAKYETDSQKLKEMHTYLVRLYALLNAYKATLEPTADQLTRDTLSTELEQFKAPSTAISTGYDNYADMPKWKQNAAFWGIIFGCIALGLLIGAAAGAISGFIFPFVFGLGVVAIAAGSPPAAWIIFGTYCAIGGAALCGVIGSIIGGFCGTCAAEEYVNDGTKRPRYTFFQKQGDLIAKVSPQPTIEAPAPAEHHGRGNDGLDIALMQPAV